VRIEVWVKGIEEANILMTAKTVASNKIPREFAFEMIKNMTL